eukprot:gnl/MRDRNA2_/MRDRNA2_89925_c0_seq1.p1 gnl/MRDRNA2_/MRDRNA2_89925_c0~~gnl/MRDRNA2_/MRDRNA2_89925_c0_seq1.p1  ORF type:complete len:136 (-),score=41.79 gnl/MRDRNA2_/MRDRNA2_89925_c0_seq1:52-459(-)
MKFTLPSLLAVRLVICSAHVGTNLLGSSVGASYVLTPGEKERAKHALEEVKEAEAALAKANSALEDAGGSEKEAKKALQAVKKAEHAVDNANKAIKAHNEGLETKSKEPSPNHSSCIRVMVNILPLVACLFVITY